MSEWQPINQYDPEMGYVLVWLTCPVWSSLKQRHEQSGEWVKAWPQKVRDSLIWCNANDGTPLETGSRRVTHFMIPAPPTPKDET